MSNKDYLDYIRHENKMMMSKCHYCEKFSIGIIAEGHIVRPVCKVHDTRSLEEIEKDID